MNRLLNKTRILKTVSLMLCVSIITPIILANKAESANVSSTSSFFKAENSTLIVKNESNSVKLSITPSSRTARINYLNYIDSGDLSNFITLQVLPSVAKSVDFLSMDIILEDALNPKQQILTSLAVQNVNINKKTVATVALTDATEYKPIEDKWLYVDNTGGYQYIANSSQLTYGYDNGGWASGVAQYINTGTALHGDQNWQGGYYFDQGVNGSPGSNNHFGYLKKDTNKDCIPFTLSFVNHEMKIDGINLPPTYTNGYKVAKIDDVDFLSKSVSALASDSSLRSRYTIENVTNMFSSGKVKLSLRFNGIQEKNKSFNKINLRIKAIKGQDFTKGGGFQDTSSPVIDVALQSNAVAGMKYVLPKAVAYDSVDGKINEVNVEVFNEKNEKVIITNNTILPLSYGLFKINYIANDKNSNTTTKILDLKVFESNPGAKFTFQNNFKNEYAVGERIIFPVVSSTSPLSEFAEHQCKTSIYVQKDGKVLKTFSADKSNNQYFIPSIGTYEIALVADAGNGLYNTEFYRFQAKNKPVINAQLFEPSYAFNKPIHLEKIMGYYKGHYYPTALKVTAPDGTNIVIEKDTLLPKLLGDYLLNYSFTLNGVTANETTKVNVKYTAEAIFYNVNKIKKIVPNSDLPSFSEKGNGLLISADTPGAKAQYVNKINLNNFTKDDTLLSFQALYGNGYGKFEDLKIKLIDVKDDKNEVVVSFKPHTEHSIYSWANVNYDGRTLARDYSLNGKISEYAQFGCLLLNTMKGVNEAKLFRLSYDSNEKAFYINTNFAGAEKWKLLDLDDGRQVGIGREWKGFTTNEIYLQLELKGEGENGIIVTETAKQSLKGKFIEDKMAPSLNIGIDTSFLNSGIMPLGQLDKTYPIPTTTAFDFISGECAVITQLLNPQGKDISQSIVNNSFTPTSIGKYTLVYKAKDLSGNWQINQLSINVQKSVDNITLSFKEKPKAAYAGDWYTLPQIASKGGSGKVSITQEYYMNDKKVTPDSLNRIFLDGKGKILVKIKANDYLETPLSNSSLNIPITAKQTPSIFADGLPISAETGKSLVLNDFDAVDYNGKTVTRKISVNNKVIFSSTGSKKDKIEYKVTETQGSLLILKYEAFTSIGSTAKSYTVPVIVKENSGSRIIPYEVRQNRQISYFPKGIVKDLKSDYALIKFSGYKGFLFPQPIPAKEFAFKFDVDKDNNQIEWVDVIFEDYQNPEIKAFFRLTHENGKSYIAINANNQRKIEVIGSFEDNNTYFHFLYNNKTLTLNSIDGKAIDKIQKCINGATFEGFPSGIVRFSLEVKAKSDIGSRASINMMQIANQVFSFNASDTVGPVIITDKVMDNAAVKIGTQVAVSAANAYDVLCGKTDVKLKIIDPSGNVVGNFNNISANKEFNLDCNKYGYWKIQYSAKDANNKTTNMICSINVKNSIEPKIKLSSKLPTKVVAGSNFVVPKATATDSLSKECKLYIFIQYPNMQLVPVASGETKQITATGNYKIIYYAYDDEYNSAKVEGSFNVSVR